VRAKSESQINSTSSKPVSYLLGSTDADPIELAKRVSKSGWGIPASNVDAVLTATAKNFVSAAT
jgi:hypothetical protein